MSTVLGMVQASIDDRHYGPWMLYVPTGYQTVLDEDYSTSYGETIRQRIMKIGGDNADQGIAGIGVSDYLTAHNIVLVEMTRETVEMVIGMQPTPVQWQEQGGMVEHHKIMAIMVPRLRADKDGRAGVIHAS